MKETINTKQAFAAASILSSNEDEYGIFLQGVVAGVLLMTGGELPCDPSTVFNANIGETDLAAVLLFKLYEMAKRSAESRSVDSPQSNVTRNAIVKLIRLRLEQKAYREDQK